MHLHRQAYVSYRPPQRHQSHHGLHMPHLHWDRLSVMAVLCPPAAVALSHEPDQLLLNFVLTLCLWVPGVVHALWIVSRHQAHNPEYGTDQIVAALRNHLRR